MTFYFYYYFLISSPDSSSHLESGALRTGFISETRSVETSSTCLAACADVCLEGEEHILSTAELTDKAFGLAQHTSLHMVCRRLHHSLCCGKKLTPFDLDEVIHGEKVELLAQV